MSAGHVADDVAVAVVVGSVLLPTSNLNTIGELVGDLDGELDGELLVDCGSIGEVVGLGGVQFGPSRSSQASIRDSISVILLVLLAVEIVLSFSF